MSLFKTDPNVTLNRKLEDATAELRNQLKTTTYNGSGQELDRVTKYHLYWKFYEGLHYREFNDSMMTFNYVRAFIDKVNAFLVGDTCFTLNVTSYSNDVVTEEVEKNVERLLLKNWRKNKMNLFTHELLQMGSICGDAWVGVNWDIELDCCRLSLYDSRQCFPEFEDGDYNKMSAFTIRQYLPDSKDYTLKVYRFTKDRIQTWLQKGSTQNISERERKYLTDEENPLGFIPIVHFKNRPKSTGYYSTSDAQDILKLNKVYNELNQELKAIIDYHATPTTVVTGATMKNLKRGLGNIWSGLPPEASVFNLGLDVDLSGTTSFIQAVKTAMHEISDVPENVLGKIQSISGTSAAALKLTYQPLVQQANLKALTYGEGITELNEFILKFYDKYSPDDADYKEIPKDFIRDYRAEPVFSYGFPTDRMAQLQEAQVEFQLNIASKKEIMNRIGKNNVPDLLKEIANEKLKDAELNKEISDIQSPQSIPQNPPTQTPPTP